MTHATMRVAVWEHSLGLVPHEDDVPQFADVRLDVLYDDGCLLFVTSATGTPLHYKERPDTRGKPPCHAFEFRLDRTGCGLLDLPRFALHEVDMAVDDSGDMTWEMPPTHELPWPGHVHNMSFDSRVAVARRELKMRVDSTGGDLLILRKVAETVPPWARDVIGTQQWIDIFEGAM